MKERLNLQTYEGSRSIFRISVIVVILFSFLAYMLASGWGSVKISELNIDSRGSVMQATMYIPRNTNSETNLPCVIFTHGLSCLCGRTGQAWLCRAQCFHLRLR